MIEYKDQTRCPRDEETILSSKEYSRTKMTMKGARVYKKGNYYYHRDTFHKGYGAHLEVYNKRGKHIGEADIYTGELIPNTEDKEKHLDL